MSSIIGLRVTFTAACLTSDHGNARIQLVTYEEATIAGWDLPGDVPVGELVVCSGDGQFRSSEVGSAHAPNKRILHAMWPRHRVFMVIEAETTAYYYGTELPLKRVWSDGLGQVRWLLWCDNRQHQQQRQLLREP
jgi:hypothetical protein